MPKNIEDIIPPDRGRSIRNIPIPAGHRRTDKKAVSIPVNVKEEIASPPVSSRNPDFPRRKRASRKRIWLAAALSALILVLAILSLFNGATFAYVPKSAQLTFNNETYTAKKSGADGLFYSVVKLSREKGMSAPAGGEADVERKASGVIVVYNTGANSQTLVENTRFESPTSKIYRINKAITVPAKGSVEATVYADAAGLEYNADLVDFTVPGLKGTPRFSTVYARSKTPMTGGFVGKEKVVKAEDLAKTKTELQKVLKEELWQEVQAEVPDDFVLFSSLLSYTFEDMPQGTGSGNSVTVNSRGNLYGVMFKKADLAGYLTLKKLNLSKSELVEISSLDSLNISFAGPPPAVLLTLNEVNFKISGNTTVLWLTDEVALKADLLGKSKGEIPAILKNYPTVASASVTVRPFWKSSLPSTGEKVSIKKMSVQ